MISPRVTAHQPTPCPAPVTVRNLDHRARVPTLTVPQGIMLELPMRAEINAGCRWQDGLQAAPVATIATVFDCSAYACLSSADIDNQTTRAGWAGADCQPTWGTSVAFYAVATNHSYERGKVATLAAPAAAPVLADNGMLWIAEVTSAWSASENGSSTDITAITLHALADIYAATRSTAQAGEAAHAGTRLAAWRALAEDPDSADTWAQGDPGSLRNNAAAAAIDNLRTLCSDAGVDLDQAALQRRPLAMAMIPSTQLHTPSAGDVR